MVVQVIAVKHNALY